MATFSSATPERQFVTGHLPVRALVQPGEELYSFVRRNADQMGYEQLALILHPEMSSYHIQSTSLLWLSEVNDYLLLKQLLNLDTAQLVSLTVHSWSQYLLSPQEQQPAATNALNVSFLPHQLFSRLILTHTSCRVCPLCLAEPIIYDRLQWTLREMVTCPKHRVLLVTTCHQCGAYIQMTRRSLTQCDKCQADLRDAPVSSAPEVLVNGNVWLLHRLNQTSEMNVQISADWQNAPLTSMPDWIALSFVPELMDFLWRHTIVREGQLHYRRLQGRASYRQDDPSFTAWCEYLSYAYRVVTDWPRELVSAFNQLDEEKLLTPFCAWLLKRRRRYPEEYWPHEAFATFVRQKHVLCIWKTHIRSGYANPSKATRQRPVTSLMPLPSPVHELVSDRWLAVHILGLPLSIVHRLIALGVLSPTSFATSPLRNYYWFSWQYLYEWIENLCASIELQTDCDSLSLICLREFEPARLVAIFRSIYEGKTPVYVQQSGNLLGHILAVPANAVVDGSVGHMKHTPRPPSLLSNEEAAKELDCSIPYLLKLLQRGLLRNSQGSEARNGIFLQDVLAFQREYQFAEDAARAHAIPLKEIELWSCYIPALVVMRFRHADTTVLVLRRTIVTFILNHRLPLASKDLQSGHLPFKGNIDYQTIMQVQYILGRLIRSDDSSLIVPPTFQYLPFLVMWRKYRNLGVNQLARKAGINGNELHTLETCRGRTKNETIKRLADALGLSKQQLLYENPQDETQ